MANIFDGIKNLSYNVKMSSIKTMDQAIEALDNPELFKNIPNKILYRDTFKDILKCINSRAKDNKININEERIIEEFKNIILSEGAGERNKKPESSAGLNGVEKKNDVLVQFIWLNRNIVKSFGETRCVLLHEFCHFLTRDIKNNLLGFQKPNDLSRAFNEIATDYMAQVLANELGYGKEFKSLYDRNVEYFHIFKDYLFGGDNNIIDSLFNNDRLKLINIDNKTDGTNVVLDLIETFNYNLNEHKYSPELNKDFIRVVNSVKKSLKPLIKEKKITYGDIEKIYQNLDELYVKKHHKCDVHDRNGIRNSIADSLIAMHYEYFKQADDKEVTAIKGSMEYYNIMLRISSNPIYRTEGEIKHLTDNIAIKQIENGNVTDEQFRSIMKIGLLYGIDGESRKQVLDTYRKQKEYQGQDIIITEPVVVDKKPILKLEQKEVIDDSKNGREPLSTAAMKYAFAAYGIQKSYSTQDIITTNPIVEATKNDFDVANMIFDASEITYTDTQSIIDEPSVSTNEEGMSYEKQ
ncbi:MAG TPA: hypothetical protein DEP72_05105 [Clostridiales bacterium]|nr:MAG: hypothetical protein A2Y18_02255 [Clostridiales bacterium GWD2_32_19]HCC07519.1 hypothetical protein [Clostridiales bacterium]